MTAQLCCLHKFHIFGRYLSQSHSYFRSSSARASRAGDYTICNLFSFAPISLRRFGSMEAPPKNNVPSIQNNSELLTPPPGYQVIREGKAAVIHKEASEVFYNPVQQTNRDLSIAMIKLHRETRQKEYSAYLMKRQAKGLEPHPPADFTILEALSATGLRSIRYWKEIEGVSHIVANDLDEAAVAAIRRNVEFNGISTEHIVPNHADATVMMYNHKSHEKQFEVVDLDPYGTASPFLDGAVQAVRDGGLLAVTCTDLAVLCGNHAEVCYSKYGAMSLKSPFCHEMAVRMVLQSIESAANRYRRHIEPLLALHIDFYVRMFVRVHESAEEVKRTPSKLAYVFQCEGCHAYHLQPLGKISESGGAARRFAAPYGPPVGPRCELCNGRFQLGGPIWAAPCHTAETLQWLKTHLEQHSDQYGAHKRVQALVNTASEELLDVPLFYSLADLVRIVHMASMPSELIKSALRERGHRVGISHTDPLALKTTAPPAEVWGVLKSYREQHPPVKPKEFPTESAPAKLLSTPALFSCKFEPQKEGPFDGVMKDKKSKTKKVPRFLPNPEENWGPKPRATGSKKRSKDTEEDEGEADQEENKQARN